jgi:hypothetical protein
LPLFLPFQPVEAKCVGSAFISTISCKGGVICCDTVRFELPRNIDGNCIPSIDFLADPDAFLLVEGGAMGADSGFEMDDDDVRRKKGIDEGVSRFCGGPFA